MPAKHPLRQVRELVRAVLKDLSPSFGKLYSSAGRPSIPPEQLLSALLLQVFYGIRSERQLMEQLDYNLLYRWFAGLAPDDPVWDTTTFTKNRDRLQHGEVFQKWTVFGNRFAGLASAVERKDLIRLCPCRWSASAIFPLAMSFRDPFFLPFEHYLPLEFGNRAKDRQHHFSGRARRVKIHVQDAEPNVLGLQRVANN